MNILILAMLLSSCNKFSLEAKDKPKKAQRADAAAAATVDDKDTVILREVNKDVSTLEWNVENFWLHLTFGFTLSQVKEQMHLIFEHLITQDKATQMNRYRRIIKDLTSMSLQKDLIEDPDKDTDKDLSQGQIIEIITIFNEIIIPLLEKEEHDELSKEAFLVVNNEIFLKKSKLEQYQADQLKTIFNIFKLSPTEDEGQDLGTFKLLIRIYNPENQIDRDKLISDGWGKYLT